jgi:hypothetical protein
MKVQGLRPVTAVYVMRPLTSAWDAINKIEARISVESYMDALHTCLYRMTSNSAQPALRTEMHATSIPSRARSSRLKPGKNAIASEYRQVTAANIGDGATATEHHSLLEFGEKNFDRESNSFLAIVLYALVAILNDR